MTGRGFRRLAPACVAALVLSAQPGAMAQEAAPPPAASLAPAPPPSRARGPTPQGLSIWAGLVQQNYPPEAARLMLEGSVRVRAIVDPQGWVTECLVIQSSGHDLLDTAACDGMRRFAVFNPALDADGRPTVGTYATIITYRAKIPPPSGTLQTSAAASKARALSPRSADIWAARIKEDYPRVAALQLLEGSVGVRVWVNALGLVDECEVIASSTHDILDQAACESMRKYARFNPALDAEGQPTWGTFTTLITYRIDQPVPPPEAPPSVAVEGGAADL